MTSFSGIFGMPRPQPALAVAQPADQPDYHLVLSNYSYGAATGGRGRIDAVVGEGFALGDGRIEIVLGLGIMLRWTDQCQLHLVPAQHGQGRQA